MPRGKNRKPRSERRAKQQILTARERYEMEILDTVRCPLATVERIDEMSDDGVAAAVDAFTFLNTASHVWRDRLEAVELHRAIEVARGAFEPFMESMLLLGKQRSRCSIVQRSSTQTYRLARSWTGSRSTDTPTP